ncbi:putative cytochrome P450 E-class, group IV [Cladorrhinum sp. PSN259]|nr:putative cytochrome P450 E-class, group IV [Cladorrhinum sp. PSN259]
MERLRADSATLLIIILSLTAAFILTDLIHRIKRWRRLRHIPGPSLAGWTSLWLTRRFIAYKVFDYMIDLSEKYGPLVRVAPNTVICTDIDTLYRISGARTLYKKSKWYNITRIIPNSNNILSIRDPEARKQRLRHILPGYTCKPTTCDSYPSAFEAGTHRALTSFIYLIESKYLSTANSFRPMDFSEKCQFYTLDAFGKRAYTESFGTLQNDKDVLAHQANGTKPDAKKRREDMLQSFIDHGLEGDELVHEVAMSFFVASDTLASSLRLTSLLLLTHPRGYAGLQRELDSALPPTPSDCLLTAAQTKSVGYLQCVIKESLRLFPASATLPFSKEVPEQGDTLCGYNIPGGTEVSTGSVIYAMGREKKVWGEDADIFRPERWEEQDEEALSKMNRAWELVFGSGRFVCVGRGIGMMELGIVIGELVRRYDWSLPNTFHLPQAVNTTVWEVHGLVVKVERRKK